MSIFETLQSLHLTSKDSRVVFNDRTRDVEGLRVWKDKVSGVIYIDEFYTGNETYIKGSYREDKSIQLNTGKPDFERANDSERRFKSNFKYVAGKKVVDFGCGSGDFLRLAKPYCESVLGIELQRDYIDGLNSDGIRCLNDIDKIEDSSVDVVVSFHVIEHLPSPLETLNELKSKVVSGGMILIEVPHANDFLLSVLGCDQFKQFTLWSQHLVLHTRASLRRTLEYVGLENVQIEGVQRYPLSNHLHWLSNGKAGGHKSALSMLESASLFEAYQHSLARIDATDTLVAIAKVP
ncbi:MAG: methyltransferase [Thalassospira sp.]|uniref:class I SAM-dependent methyltransferase n=1 Tax=Thalassospira sp. GB04J01 TaxID=1485225 RepID=UPI000C0EC2CB|nr:class I SAM-dependent methyltransferase [Thalassospira sp. GB04J01]MBV16641.1 methyltransferase [Thalassospira sp.]|tara:strand:- start:66486 stop:67364 length:879 start_codon:yes stop_codon:yes gene_type:complete